MNSRMPAIAYLCGDGTAKYSRTYFKPTRTFRSVRKLDAPICWLWLQQASLNQEISGSEMQIYISLRQGHLAI